MHFPEFQGSSLTWTEFPETFHLRGIRRNQPARFLLNRTNSISPAKILIYEFSSDKLLKRELSGCRGPSSAVKQMWGKPFLCGNEQVSNLRSASEGVQPWYVIWISKNYMILERTYLRFRTEMWQICWHHVCTLLHSIWRKVMWSIWRVHLHLIPLQRVYCCGLIASLQHYIQPIIWVWWNDPEIKVLGWYITRCTFRAKVINQHWLEPNTSQTQELDMTEAAVTDRNTTTHKGETYTQELHHDLHFGNCDYLLSGRREDGYKILFNIFLFPSSIKLKLTAPAQPL